MGSPGTSSNCHIISSLQGSFEQKNTVNNDVNNISKLSQNDNGFCVSVASSCNCPDVHHNDDYCTLVLKPCKSVDYAGKSIVHYYLHHRSDIGHIDAVASINKVNTNITNLVSQGSCQSSKCVRVVNIEVDDTEMPDIDYMDAVNIMSVMNWVKLGETFIEYRLTYIHLQASSQLKGFYWAEYHASEFIWYLSPFLPVPEGNLQVLYFLYVVVDDGCDPSCVNDMEADIYLNYVKDLVVDTLSICSK